MTLFAFSCQTDNAKPDQDILFADLDPDIDMQSVRAFVTDPNAMSSGCPKIPVPFDSLVVYILDLTHDQSPDFRIEVAHSFEGHCGKCKYFTYNISITGLKAGHAIARSDSEHPIVRIFTHGDTINASHTWVDRGDIHLLDGCSAPSYIDIPEGYIGLKADDSYGYLHIAPTTYYGIRIMDYGYNASKNGIISCGQQE